MTQLPEEAINIGALTHANSLLRLWHQEPLTMEQAELMPDWESYREHLKDALTAVYPAIEKQIRAQISAATCAHEPHDLRISAGDEEIWVSCTCGWHVPGFWPASASADLDAAWEAWYWPHAIKEEIKAETAARIAEG